MSSADPIDISSSDSDRETENNEFNTSTMHRSGNHRFLPCWASASSSNTTSTEFGGSTSRIHPSGNGHDYNGNSKIFSDSATNDRKLLSQLALKRSLPSSFWPSVSSVKSSNLAGAGPTPTSTTNKGYFKEYNNNGIEEMCMHENNRTLELLPSLAARSGSSQLGGWSGAASRFLVAEEKVLGNDERMIYQAAVEDLHQPNVEANMPEGLLSVPLLRHQKIALAWMLQRETRSLHCLGGILADDQGLGKTISMIALIQMQKFFQSRQKPEEQSAQETEAVDLDTEDTKSIADIGTAREAFLMNKRSAGTLIVCPASILRQWAWELENKVSKKAKLSFVMYHGGGRTKDHVELAKYDVVLTTYSIVANEVPKQLLVEEGGVNVKNGKKYCLSSVLSANRSKSTSNIHKKKKKGMKQIDNCLFDSDCGPLAKVIWSRVILDEAQTIKNYRTQAARACCGLRSKKRWCLSGTPLQNTVDDLYSYFRFLRYEPYSAYKSFYDAIKAEISRDPKRGYLKLQVVLRAVMLRRTKGTLICGEPIITLPPKSICLKRIEFSPEERIFYTRLEADSRSKFKAFAATDTVRQNYASILLMLLRLRQACNHPHLAKDFHSDSVMENSLEMANQLPRDMVIDLLNLLAASHAICLVCQDPPEDPVVTMCGHVFCQQCVWQYITGDDTTCQAPGCKEQLGSDIVFTRSVLSSCLPNNSDPDPNISISDVESVVLQNEYSSSKIKAVIEILQAHSKVQNLNGSIETSTASSDSSMGKPIKTIIFSQWNRMLDWVGRSLKQHGVEFRRFDGAMSLIARDKALMDFSNNPKVTVILMSLKAGNLGLNMVAACRVILLDLWWNPTTEDQAIDRAHRIGQTSSVTVTRVTVKDTVEDRILSLQEEKRRMIASAFGEDEADGSAMRLTPQDLKYLFNVE